MEGGTIWSTHFYRVALLPPHRPPREEQPQNDYADPQTVRDNMKKVKENEVCTCMNERLVRLILMCKH